MCGMFPMGFAKANISLWLHQHKYHVTFQPALVDPPEATVTYTSATVQWRDFGRLFKMPLILAANFLKITKVINAGGGTGGDDAFTKSGDSWAVPAGSLASSSSLWTMCKCLRTAPVHIKCHQPLAARSCRYRESGLFSSSGHSQLRF